MKYLKKYNESYSDWLSQLGSDVTTSIKKKSEEIVEALKLHLEDDLNITDIDYEYDDVNFKISVMSSQIGIDNPLPITFIIKTTSMTDEILTLIDKYAEYLDDASSSDDIIDKLYDKIIDRITKYVKPLTDKFSKKYELPIRIADINLGDREPLFSDINIELELLYTCNIYVTEKVDIRWEKQNESMSNNDIADIFKLNLEGNSYFDVDDIVVHEYQSDNEPGYPIYHYVHIIEDFGENSLLWKQTYDGVPAEQLSPTELTSKIAYINKKLLSAILKKYDIKHIPVWAWQKQFFCDVDFKESYSTVECKFKILT